jgi:hypothetical protein
VADVIEVDFAEFVQTEHAGHVKHYIQMNVLGRESVGHAPDGRIRGNVHVRLDANAARGQIRTFTETRGYEVVPAVLQLQANRARNTSVGTHNKYCVHWCHSSVSF